MADIIPGLDLSRNFSLFSIPAAFVLCMVPNVWAVSLSRSSYDPAFPRKFVATVAADTRLDKPTQQKIARAKAASDNGFETLGLFAAAVLAANHAALPPLTLNLLSLGYILARAFYVFAYVHLGADRRLAPVRSGFWLAGNVVTMVLLFRAGLAVLRSS